MTCGSCRGGARNTVGPRTAPVAAAEDGDDDERRSRSPSHWLKTLILQERRRRVSFQFARRDSSAVSGVSGSTFGL